MDHNLIGKAEQKIEEPSDNWENEEICDKNLDGVTVEEEVVPDTQISVDSHSSKKEGSEDSGSDFEAKIRKLFPGSYSGVEASAPPQVKDSIVEGNRRSGRQKKPSLGGQRKQGTWPSRLVQQGKKGPGTTTSPLKILLLPLFYFRIGLMLN